LIYRLANADLTTVLHDTECGVEEAAKENGRGIRKAGVMTFSPSEARPTKLKETFVVAQENFTRHGTAIHMCEYGLF